LDVAEFGKFIRRLRERKEMTLSRLAALSRVSHPYLSQIENGRLKGMPSPEILKKLAEPLGVDYATLMYRAGHYDEEMYKFIMDYERRSRELTSAVLMALRSFSEDGYILARFRTEIFQILSHYMVGPEYEKFNSHIEWLLKQAAEDEDNVTGDMWEDAYREFDMLYNIKELENQFTRFISDESKEQILSELTELAHKHGIINLNELPGEAIFELTELLHDERITYNGHPLNEEDRRRILDMLAILFPDRQ